jgi:hypothetical protein
MRRKSVIILATLLFLLLLFFGLGGWHFSNLIDERALDGAARRASYPGEHTLRVAGFEEGRIVLEPLAGKEVPELTLEGEWGLRWDDGYGWARSSQDGWFLQPLEGDPPQVGASASIDVRMFPDAERIPTRSEVENVTIPGPLGDYPAWFWSGERSTWAIVVHGNSMSRLDGARAVPIFERLGFPVLVPTYRNDEGAPEDPSGKLRYGLTEWQDLEAAVDYALNHGATDVILDGYSMGGGTVMAFMQRSELADNVTAIILDAPMLDFGQTVDDNASRETLPVIGLPLPSSLTALAKQMAAWRFGVDWQDLNYIGSDPGVPTLVFHGTADMTVPISTSIDFASRHPNVSLESCPGADHTECWNVDSEGYEDRLNRFIAEDVLERSETS